uniref:tyrosine-type recombinase/integrase n=1 Tax=Photorhabdus sp. RM322S TaxID=3342825 RepID=UPI0036DD5B1F
MAGSINRLTDKKLKTLNSSTRDKEMKISDGAGLMLRVSKNGVISWFFKYRIGGRESEASRVTLGRYPDLSLSKAREIRDLCREWLANGQDPKRMLKLNRETSLKPATVYDALEYWFSEYATENLVNAENLHAKVKKHIYPYIGDMALKDCETRHWLECFNRIKKNAPSVAGVILQVAQQAFKFCNIRRYATYKELIELTLQDIGVKVNRRKKVLSTKEIKDLLVALRNNFFSPYYENLIYLLIVFGARTVEVRLSKMDEWDLNEKIWTVPESNNKTKEKILRPIPDTLIERITHLKHQNKNSEWLLGEFKENTAVSSTGGRIWQRLEHTEQWSLHDLRRTFSTGMSDIGIPPHIVELLLGHTLGGVMAIYNRSQYLPEKLDALNKWTERLDVLAGNHENVVLLNNKTA